MSYDVFLVGVGGQGVLTIGEILAETAVAEGMPVSFFPTKGMAQRGGFVKAQLRLGREAAGPQVAERGVDLVIAVEVSEALRAVRYVKPGGEFLLFGHVWAPTAVMLGKETYPELDAVLDQARQAGARVCYLDPHDVPVYEGTPVPANVYVVGAAMGHTDLGQVLDADRVRRTIETRWKRGVERNALAFRAGLTAQVRAE